MCGKSSSALCILPAAVSLSLHSAGWAQVPPPPVSPAPVVDVEYDANGNLRKLIQAKGLSGLGFETMHSYDALHRRFMTTDPRGKNTVFGYNGREDLTSVTDPRGLVTTYPRNGLADPLGVVSPDTGTAGHSVDTAGNVRTRTDSRGVVATYDYDALNRLTSVTYSQVGLPIQSFGWTYDQSGPGFSYGLGRLTSTQFTNGSATYAYDALGRLVSTTQTVTGARTVVTSTGYSYDAAGHVTGIAYPSGRVLTIAYSAGQPLSLTLTPVGGGSAIPLLSDLSFEPGPGAPGALRSWNWNLNSGVLAHARVFDVYGRMVRYPLGGALRDLTYDAADRIVAYTHWDANSGAAVTALDQAFGYDELGRLTTVSSSVGGWTIGYDDNGNRSAVTFTGSGGAVTRNYITSATSNRLDALDNPARSLVYDPAGNLTSDVQAGSSSTVLIDPSGRVSRITASGPSTTTTANYFYDASGLRVRKRAQCEPAVACAVPLEVTTFVYDQEGQLLGEYRNDGTAVREYVWLQGIPVVIIDGTASSPVVYYVQADHLGTPRTVIDRAGVQRWTWVAEPFGNSAPVENPVGFGVFKLNLRMPGQYFDVESGLAYNWHRGYDATIGRYTQSDPIGLAGGINTYAYAFGSPTDTTDPDGLNPALAVYRAGRVGWQIGEAINPYVQPYIAQALEALLLPDFNDPTIILAQNNKQTRKRIAGLQAHIDEHKKKLDKEPDCQASNHWRNEIAAAEAEIARLRMRLPNGR